MPSRDELLKQLYDISQKVLSTPSATEFEAKVKEQLKPRGISPERQKEIQLESQLMAEPAQLREKYRELDPTKREALVQRGTSQLEEQLNTLRAIREAKEETMQERIGSLTQARVGETERLRTSAGLISDILQLTKPTGTGTSISTKREADFWDAIEQGKKELMQNIPWGEVWNKIKVRFPDFSDDMIDQGLGTSWKQAGAYEKWYAGKKPSALEELAQ